VIGAPFRADETVAQRLAELVARTGPAVQAEVEAIVAASTTTGGDPLIAGTVSAADVARLVNEHDLASERELALLSLPVAGAMASPPISGYRVAAAGIEAETGDLVLGGNQEFPGGELGSTIHAEGFVSLRARRRGHTLETLAVSEAHPCAHCRQTLAEADAADGLEIIDLLGHELTLAELYPWPFRPSALGVAGDRPGEASWPGLTFAGDPPPDDAAGLLLEVGSRAHAPYSRSPSAVVLRIRGGRHLAAGCVESVAFNPSITALQAALVEVAAARVPAAEILEAWLARIAGGAVDPAPGFRGLLSAVAPSAEAHVVDWRADAAT
jgi:cytidine deaminase